MSKCTYDMLLPFGILNVQYLNVIYHQNILINMYVPTIIRDRNYIKTNVIFTVSYLWVKRR